MIELIVKELISSGIAIAKEIISTKVKEDNNKRLQQKKERARKQLVKSEEIAKLTLRSEEELSCKIFVSKEESYQSLTKHLQYINRWSTQIGFNDLRGTKDIHNIYIELDTYLTPLRSQIDTIERSHTKALREVVLDGFHHSIILGQPGAGKTTSMKKLCSMFFNETNNIRANHSIPLLIRLRELNTSTESKFTLHDAILEIISIKFEFSYQQYTGGKPEDISSDALIAFLDELKPLIILDGFDEIASHEVKKSIVEELRRLTSSLSKAKILLTCRSGEFNYNLENSETFEIAPLNTEQIKNFVNNWLESPENAQQFLNDIQNSPFADTAIKPLSLAHLCAIYERIGKIPDRPKTVYKKIVGLLLEEWDQQRSIKRISSYSKFEADRKFEFLANLAYYFTVNIRRTVFETSNFTEAYCQIYKNFNLEKDQSSIIASELESHTGLFIQSGYDQFEFVHKSLQEYLTAEYIVKLPNIPKDENILQYIANELAIAVSISSNPSIYFTELVINVFNPQNLPNTFYDTFVNRLLVEKPDFYEYDEIILALYTLLSLWICKGKITGRTIDIRRIDETAFEKYHLFISIFDTQSLKDALLKYYYISEKKELLIGNIPIYKIRRKKQHAEYSLPSFMLSFD